MAEMPNDELARVEMVREHLKQRGRICYAMVAGGMICLVAGVAMLVVGLTGDQVVWFQSGSFKITAGGFGAVTMLASVAWGYVAHMARPEIEFHDPEWGVSLGSSLT